MSAIGWQRWIWVFNSEEIGKPRVTSPFTPHHSLKNIILQTSQSTLFTSPLWYYPRATLKCLLTTETTGFMSVAHWSLSTFTVFLFPPREEICLHPWLSTGRRVCPQQDGCCLYEGFSLSLPTPSQALPMLEESVEDRGPNVGLQEASQWEKAPTSVEHLLCAYCVWSTYCVPAVCMALSSSHILTCLYLSVDCKFLTVRGWVFSCFCAHQWLPLGDAQQLIIKLLPNTIPNSVICNMG